MKMSLALLLNTLWVVLTILLSTFFSVSVVDAQRLVKSVSFSTQTDTGALLSNPWNLWAISRSSSSSNVTSIRSFSVETLSKISEHNFDATSLFTNVMTGQLAPGTSVNVVAYLGAQGKIVRVHLSALAPSPSDATTLVHSLSSATTYFAPKSSLDGNDNAIAYFITQDTALAHAVAFKINMTGSGSVLVSRQQTLYTKWWSICGNSNNSFVYAHTYSGTSSESVLRKMYKSDLSLAQDLRLSTASMYTGMVVATGSSINWIGGSDADKIIKVHLSLNGDSATMTESDGFLDTSSITDYGMALISDASGSNIFVQSWQNDPSKIIKVNATTLSVRTATYLNCSQKYTDHAVTRQGNFGFWASSDHLGSGSSGTNGFLAKVQLDQTPGSTPTCADVRLSDPLANTPSPSSSSSSSSGLSISFAVCSSWLVVVIIVLWL